LDLAWFVFTMSLFGIDMITPLRSADLYSWYDWLGTNVDKFALLFRSGGDPINGTCTLGLRVGHISPTEMGSQSFPSGDNLINGAVNLVGL